MVLNKNN